MRFLIRSSTLDLRASLFGFFAGESVAGALGDLESFPALLEGLRVRRDCMSVVC